MGKKTVTAGDNYLERMTSSLFGRAAIKTSPKVVKPKRATKPTRKRRATARTRSVPRLEYVEWPFLTTRAAASYCKFQTTQGLRKAWYKLEVFPCARRGGVRPRSALMWEKKELDRYLRGDLITPRQVKQRKLLLPPLSSVQEHEADE